MPCFENPFGIIASCLAHSRVQQMFGFCQYLYSSAKLGLNERPSSLCLYNAGLQVWTTTLRSPFLKKHIC